MKKVERELCNIVEKLEGNLIGIGLSEPKLLDRIEKNSKITECTLLNDETGALNEESGRGTKKLNIRKLRKKFKKKRIDTIICATEQIAQYTKTFVKDSIFITKGTIYFYGDDFEMLENIQEKYKRYQVSTKQEKYGQSYLYVVEVNGAKNHRIKEIGYYVKDTVMNGVDYLSDYLVH